MKIGGKRCLILGASACLSAMAALSQASAQSLPDPISQCKEQAADKDAQIACLEAAVAQLMQDSDNQRMALSNETDDADAPAGLGAEQVTAKLRRKDNSGDKSDKHEDLNVSAALSDFAVTSLGTYVFFLDNGQVWRQKSSDPNRVRLSDKRDYTIQVSEGAISGYRLKINELRRTLLVERIK